MPVYNGERLLPETLSSLLGQTFGDFELIIGDNASSDGTREICLDFARRDGRIRYERHERNLGAMANFNSVFALGTAPLFKWAAHDDLYEPTYLQVCTGLLDSHAEAVLAQANTAFVGEDGKDFAWDRDNATYVDPLTGLLQRRPDDPFIGSSSSPSIRFWQVLSGALWGTHIFGVIRRPVLERTHLFQNFVSSDRALLAEIALLGRFEATGERLFKKRFHRQVSWALDQTELKTFLSTEDASYSRRARQLQAFFSAPLDKPIGAGSKIVCDAMVAVHCLKTLSHAVTGRDARNAARARAWRQQPVVH